MACSECLEVGDVVVLNSGGPLMTVTDLSNTYAECSWFDGDALQRADFTFATIDHADGDDDEIELDPLGYPVCQPSDKPVATNHVVQPGNPGWRYL